MKQTRRVLGITGQPSPTRSSPLDYEGELEQGIYHNAAAALIDEGRVVAAVEEERLTRRKNSGKFPARAIRFVLDSAGIQLADLDAIAFGDEGGAGDFRDPRISRQAIAEALRVELGAGGEVIERVHLVDHHTAHAASAYFPSGFDDALVCTIDGFGDDCSLCVADARSGQLQVLTRQGVDGSLGRFYSLFVSWLGYSGEHDSYRVMGLAPYGNAAAFRPFVSELYALQPEGRYRLLSIAEVRRRLSRVMRARPSDAQITEQHMDLAAAAQEAFETIVAHVLDHFRERTGHRRLCLAGGCAQNSANNGRIIGSGRFHEVFVQPASHDAGNALGAALHVWASQRSQRSAGVKIDHVYWGPSLGSTGEVAAALERWRPFAECRRLDDPNEVARLLADGKVIGWAIGRAEFGPRALGHRSILADPRPHRNRDRINALVKEREAYRPFAPAVLEEAVEQWFEIGAGAATNPFMAATARVKQGCRSRLGAVTHVDGSARLQSVSRAHNPRFWELIRAFGELTGVPVLLNTSFNTRDEPIVTSVDDALVCLLTTGLELAVVEDWLVTPRDESSAPWQQLRPALRADARLCFGPRQPPGQGRSPLRAWLDVSDRRVELSHAAARALSLADGGASIAELARQADVEAQLADIVAELLALWRRRMVVLAP